MPYIPPNSDVILCRGVPIDSDYKHTLYFNSVADQNSYFRSKGFKEFHSVSYQRERRNVITLEVPATDVYACNYLMFRNTSYGEKWFFAFVNGVEYVNDSVTDIYYTLDMMQTWMFEYTLKQCMVEREHSATDEIFKNTKPENIGYGELVCGRVRSFLLSEDLLKDFACVFTSEAYAGDLDTKPFIMYGQFCPVYGYIGNATVVNNLIKDFVDRGKQDAVLSVTAGNALMALGTSQDYDKYINQMPSTVPQKQLQCDCYGVASKIIDGQEKYKDCLPNGYKPRNKKLFGYPYNQIWISNNQGTVNEYRYEDFKLDDNGQFYFMVAGSGVGTPECVLYPMYYRGAQVFYDHAIALSGYPTIPWLGDTYKAYMAMNRNQLMVQSGSELFGYLANVASSFLGGATTVNNAADMLQAAKYDAANRGSYPKEVSQVTKTGLRQQALGGSLSALGTSISGGANLLTQMYTRLAHLKDISNIPPNVSGLAGAGSVTYGMDRFDFTKYDMCVKPEYAEIVDKFFDMYGYNTTTVKIPNTHSRPHWNYVKTIGCEIQGFLPQEAANVIKAVFDNGVTFWKNGDEVGNYTLDNSPT